MEQIAKIYTGSETDFLSNGLGTFCLYKAVEEKTDFMETWRLSAELPIEARSLVFPGCVIAVQGKKPHASDTRRSGSQFFRVDEIQKNRNRLTIEAHHILFDTTNTVIKVASDTTLTGTAGELMCDAITASFGDRPALLTPYDITTETASYSVEIKEGIYTGQEYLQAVFGALKGHVGLSIDGLKAYVTDIDTTPHKLVFGRDITSFKITASSEEAYDRIFPYDQHGLTIDSPGYIDAQTPTVHKSAIVEIEIDDSIEGEAQRKAALYAEAQSLVNTMSQNKERYELAVINPDLLDVGDTVEIWDPLVVDVIDGVEQPTDAVIVRGYEFDICRQNLKSVTFGELESAVSRAQAGSVDKVLSDEGIEPGSDGYELPIASATQLGGVKIGSGITVDPDGTISAQGSVPANAWIGSYQDTSATRRTHKLIGTKYARAGIELVQAENSSGYNRSTLHLGTKRETGDGDETERFIEITDGQGSEDPSIRIAMDSSQFIELSPSLIKLSMSSTGNLASITLRGYGNSCQCWINAPGGIWLNGNKVA